MICRLRRTRWSSLQNNYYSGITYGHYQALRGWRKEAREGGERLVRPVLLNWIGDVRVSDYFMWINGIN